MYNFYLVFWSSLSILSLLLISRSSFLLHSSRRFLFIINRGEDLEKTHAMTHMQPTSSFDKKIITRPKPSSCVKSLTLLFLCKLFFFFHTQVYPKNFSSNFFPAHVRRCKNIYIHFITLKY